MLKWFNVGLRFLLAIFVMAVLLLVYIWPLAIGIRPSGGSSLRNHWRQLRSWVREPLLKYRPA